MKNRLGRYGCCILLLLFAGATLPRAAAGYAEPPGLVIEEVGDDSTAAKAGLKVGDKLLTYDGKPLTSPAALQALVQNTAGRKEATLSVRRADKTLVLTVPSGRLGVVIRPELPPATQALYSEGVTLQQAEKYDAAAQRWTAAAKRAEESGDKAAAGWLYSQVGVAYDVQKKWQEAFEAYQAGWKLLEGGGDAAAQAQILESLAQCRWNLGDYQGARQWYEKASQTNEAAGYETWALANLAMLGSYAYARRDFPTAQGSYRRALAIRQRLAPDSLGVADILNVMGGIATLRGDLQAALELHGRALAIHERLAPDSLDLAFSLSNIGIALNARGDLKAAEQHHRRALAIRERLAPDSEKVASSLTDLGNVAFNRGDLETAQEFYRRSLGLHERQAPNSLRVAISIANLGSIAAARSDLQAAEGYYQRAREIFERLAPDSLELASTLSNLGSIAAARRDLQVAEGYHRRVLAIRERLIPESLGVASSIQNLGDIFFARLDQQAAEEYYRRALAIRERLAPDSLEVSYSLNNLGSVIIARGDFRAAQDYVRRALAIRERLAPNSMSVAGSMNMLGYIAIRERRFAEALGLFKQAVTIVEAQRSQISSPETRALLVARSTQPYAGLLSTQLALNDPPSAFATLERVRARSLTELLGERQLNMRVEVPPELKRRQDDLDRNRSDASAQLAKLDPKKDADRIALLQKELATYFVQQRELDEQFRRASPEYAALRYQQPLDLRASQAALDPGTLLLAYYVDYENTYLFAVTKTDIKVFTLPIKDEALNGQVLAFRNKVSVKRLGLNDPASLKEVGEDGKRLYDLLVRPAQEFIGRAGRILISPDGPLHALPFAALTSQVEPVSRYFIEDKPLHVIASMTVYAKTRSSTAGSKRQQKKLLAFGDPAYVRRHAEAAMGQESPQVTAERAGEQNAKAERDAEADYLRGQGLNPVPLPWARKEVEGLGRLFGDSATVRVGRDATETAARQESKDYSILHFAVHGWLDDRIGLNSALALSPPDVSGRARTREDNGLLQAWEILEQVRLNADLVVLPACETGLGEKMQGEGLIGLTRAFQYAGAKSIVVSLWKVGDESTSELMMAFYQELQKGATKDMALQKAMMAVRNNEKWRHPFYWSPFILVGEWR